MTRRFAVRTVPRFDRLLRRLSGRHPELATIYAKALDILERDPHNASQTHPIRKIEGVARDEGGQYRLRLGRFRFRYDKDAWSCSTTAGSGGRTPTASGPLGLGAPAVGSGSRRLTPAGRAGAPGRRPRSAATRRA